VTDEIKAQLADPLVKFASVAPTGLMFGVVYAMTVKPGALGSTLCMLIGLAGGAVLAQVLLRTAAGAPVPVIEAT